MNNLFNHIDGDKFEFGLDYSKKGLFYYDTDQVPEIIPGDHRVIVTHNSDSEPPKIKIPSFVDKWYAQNANHDDERLECIPIGIERKRWYPYKFDILDKADITKERKIEAFGMFNPRTFPEEREVLARLCQQNKIAASFHYSSNGQNFNTYVNNLTEYEFCLCPRGNGIDTHRVWEAIYLSCIPIIKRGYPKYEEMFSDLPVLFVDDWREISYKKLEDFSTEANKKTYNYSKLTFNYWKNKIHETCGDS